MPERDAADYNVRSSATSLPAVDEYDEADLDGYQPGDQWSQEPTSEGSFGEGIKPAFPLQVSDMSEGGGFTMDTPDEVRGRGSTESGLNSMSCGSSLQMKKLCQIAAVQAQSG